MINTEKNTRIIFTCPKDLKEKIDRAAEKEHRTVSSFIVDHFYKFFDAESTKNKKKKESE